MMVVNCILECLTEEGTCTLFPSGAVTGGAYHWNPDMSRPGYSHAQNLLRGLTPLKEDMH